MLRVRSPQLEVIPPTAYSYARPSSDISTGNWLNNSGTTPLYTAIDEVSPDQTDYIISQSLSTGQSDTCEVALSTLNNPAQNDFQAVSYSFQNTGSTSATFVVSLRQGATQIVAWTHTVAAGSSFKVRQSLTTAQITSITDYSALRLRFVASA